MSAIDPKRTLQSNKARYGKQGPPKRNDDQNKIFNDVVKAVGLDKKQVLHRQISGRNLSYHEILDIAKEISSGAITH